VRVTDTESGKNKVNINIPMGLVNVGMKMGARFVPENSDINLEELFEQIRSGAHGKIIEVIDDESGEHVEIFIE
jgi:translation elongation factor EF-1beta